MEKIKIKIRIFLWLILVGAVGWLLYKGVVPGGEISYSYDFTEPNYFITKLTPAERVEPILNGSQKIIGDPVYFSLRTPRRFDRAVLSLKYKRGEEAKLPIGSLASEKSLPIIEAGVLVDKTVWRYDLEPIENKIIDNLSMVWNKTEEGGIIFLQREKKYDSVEEFLNNLPDLNQIAVYNYNLDADYILEDYDPMELSSETSELSSSVKPLRGAYQFYTYIKNEDLNFSFEFLDLNQNKDKEDINLYLSYAGDLIDSRSISEEPREENGEEKNRGGINLELKNLPEGVYKIEVKAGDDVITKSIKTKQQKISFINKIWLYDNGGENIKLFSDSNTINAQTINPRSLQKIKIGESALGLDETYKMFGVLADKKLSSEASELSFSEIELEKDDVIISGDGIFAFSEESLINPAIKKVNMNLDIVNSNINYILADYKIPVSNGEWKTAKAEFDLTGAYREEGKYSFLISAPGLRSDDGIDDGVEVSEIRVDLKGTSLREKMVRK